jgi:hypothetical protein
MMNGVKKLRQRSAETLWNCEQEELEYQTMVAGKWGVVEILVQRQLK